MASASASFAFPPAATASHPETWRLGCHIQRVAQHDHAGERLFQFLRKLGGEQVPGAFPGKPKGMWQRTWEHHLESYWGLEEAVDAELAIGMVRKLGRYRKSD